MRHNRKNNHLSRTASHRKAMLSNMACSLIEHKRINTTVAKAKALRIFVEPLITKSKQDSTHSRRTVFSTLQSKEAVTELFREVAPKVMSRPGGYTRIIKTGFRQGDGAETAMIELVDFNEIYGNESSSKPKRRRRGGAKTTGAAAQAKADVADEVVEVVEEETTEAKAEVEATEIVTETPEAPVEAKEEKETSEAEEPKAEAPSNEEDKSSDSEEEKKD